MASLRKTKPGISHVSFRFGGKGSRGRLEPSDKREAQARLLRVAVTIGLICSADWKVQWMQPSMVLVLFVFFRVFFRVESLA
jgi:hypothetical protein